MPLSPEESVRSQLKARLEGKQAIAPMIVHKEPIVGLLNSELRAICENNPDHPMSVLKLASISGFSDDRTMYHEVADIASILENKLVDTGDTIEEHPETKERIRVRQKTLIDFPAGKAPKPVMSKKSTNSKERPEPPTP